MMLRRLEPRNYPSGLAAILRGLQQAALALAEIPIVEYVHADDCPLLQDITQVCTCHPRVRFVFPLRGN